MGTGDDGASGGRWSVLCSHTVKTAALATLVLGTGCAVLLFAPLQLWCAIFFSWIAWLGVWGPIVYTLVYAILVVCCLPAIVLTVASGVVFGPVLGTASSWAGAVLGASISFVIGRKLLEPCVLELADSYPHFTALDRAISGNAWKLVFLMRLSPLVPYTVMNYMLSLTHLDFFDYLLPSAAGIFVPTVMCVYAGSAASNIGTAFTQPSQTGLLSLGLGLGATALSVIMVARFSSKAIHTEMKRAQSLDNLGDLEVGQSKLASNRMRASISSPTLSSMFETALELERGAHKNKTPSPATAPLAGGPRSLDSLV